MNAFVRLVLVELSRFAHRRAVVLLLAASIVVPVIIGVGVVLDTRPPSAAEVAEAEQQLARDLEDPGYQESIASCVERPQEWGVAPEASAAEIEAQCREQSEPQLDWYLYDNQLTLHDELESGSGVAIALILALAMMLAGTTFTGHDWASGSVSNQLLFEPRRGRVWAAKALVVTTVALLVSAVVMTAYWLALNGVASSRDRPSGGALLLDCLQMGWRAALAAGLAALCGFALTTLFRSTVATLGILAAVGLAGGLLMAALGVDGRWNPAFNAAAFVNDGIRYWSDAPCVMIEGEQGDYCSQEHELTFAASAGYLGTAVAGTSIVSLLWFRRRDVP